MNSSTDQQLLREYTERRSEPAFAELVRRHVDLVYSAALRMTVDPHLAEDVAQGVFVALVKNAGQLNGRAALEGWLHNTARNLAANAIRGEVRRRTREQEAAIMNEMLSGSAGVNWEAIAPHLDEALGELSEPERDALLLRYFKNQDFRTVGATLGISDDTAQKRVSRAVERLREFFTKRGVTLGAGGLVVISANAVQSAPVGLAATISASSLAGTTTTTAIIATTKTIAMTTFQKTLLSATVALLVGAGIYEARQAAQLREQVQALQQQQAPMTEEIQKLQNSFADATNRLADLMAENSKLKSNPHESELLKLRGQIGVLRRQLADEAGTKAKAEQPPLKTAQEYYDRANRHEMNHEYEAQLEDLSKAIELDPNMADAYMDRGNLYSMRLPKEKGGDEKALADFTRVLEFKPNYASARWNRANMYRQLRQYDKAIADWTIYIEGDTDFSRQLEGKAKSIASALVQRGEIYKQNIRDYTKAIADYTEAIQMNANIEDAHRRRGECYELLGETEKAQQDFAIEPKRN